MKLVLAFLVATCALSCAATGGPSNPDARSQFERMKTLDGEWVALAGEGDAPAGTIVRYHVTSDASAMVETVFADTPHEMVTVYYLDGDDLVLTHYCALGNQPHMVADVGRDPDRIRFRFAGGANIDPAKTKHMHAAEFVFVGPARVRSRWTISEDGRLGDTVELSLVRSWR